MGPGCGAGGEGGDEQAAEHDEHAEGVVAGVDAGGDLAVDAGEYLAPDEVDGEQCYCGDDGCGAELGNIHGIRIGGFL